MPYKQRVGGSNPSTPTLKKGLSNEGPFFICTPFAQNKQDFVYLYCGVEERSSSPGS